MYKSIRPYVPEEFRRELLYAKPSEQEGATAKSTKQARLAHRATMAVEAKRNQDQRGLARQNSDEEPSNKYKEKTRNITTATKRKAPQSKTLTARKEATATSKKRKTPEPGTKEK